jgi:O-antigen/teichoic acid export membrane protein
MIAFSLFGLNFPLLISNRVLAAYQENATANLWVMASSVANLLGILVVIAFHGGLPLLVLGSGAAGLFVSAVGSIWLYCSHKPWLAPRRSVADFAFARELLSSSWKFFLASVAWLVNSQTDNLIIAHFLGPAAVTPYAVTFRLFAYATLIQTLAAQSVWPAYTEALARRDINWMRGIFQKNLKWGIMIAVGITALLTAFGQHIIRIWAGPIAVPPFSVIIWMAVWNVMLAYLFVMGTVLQATNHMTGIVIYSSVTAALNIVLSVWLVQLFGISGVIAATVIAYVVASLIPVTVETRTILRNLHRSHLPSPCR